jgi:two-component system, NtrC family, C4-dicarboxylate transport sensor histidine kinase DctB
VGVASLYWFYRRRVLTQLFRARNALQRARDELEQQVQARTHELRATNRELQSQIDQRQLAETELLQAGKMAVLGQMSAGLAHEVNQPLTALRALSSNTLRLLDAGRQADVRRNLASIEAAVERMARITSQLKSFARRGGDAAGAVHLSAAIANACQLLEHRLRDADITLDVVADEALQARCDGNRLEQVLVNLMGNAIDAMHDCSERRLSLRAHRQGSRVQVQVIDTGIGLAPQARGHLFEPFFTTKPVGQGLGLGLVISAQIVREYGGKLSAKSLARGMLFEFDLEALEGPANV